MGADSLTLLSIIFIASLFLSVFSYPFGDYLCKWLYILTAKGHCTISKDNGVSGRHLERSRPEKLEEYEIALGYLSV